jgi:hypothetical protein
MLGACNIPSQLTHRDIVGSFRKPLLIGASVALVALVFAVWVTDFVTVSGEWTIYTARCDSGSWQGDVCSGTLKAGERHRFRALKAHREVLYWTVGEQGESGRYLRCDVKDGRNWTCPGERQGPAAVTDAMTHGLPVIAAGTPPMHRIPKWKWALLEAGMPAGHTASN